MTGKILLAAALALSLLLAFQGGAGGGETQSAQVKTDAQGAGKKTKGKK